jgi:hypothetical protein
VVQTVSEEHASSKYPDDGDSKSAEIPVSICRNSCSRNLEEEYSMNLDCHGYLKSAKISLLLAQKNRLACVQNLMNQQHEIAV